MKLFISTVTIMKLVVIARIQCQFLLLWYIPLRFESSFCVLISKFPLMYYLNKVTEFTPEFSKIEISPDLHVTITDYFHGDVSVLASVYCVYGNLSYLLTRLTDRNRSVKRVIRLGSTKLRFLEILNHFG